MSLNWILNDFFSCYFHIFCVIPYFSPLYFPYFRHPVLMIQLSLFVEKKADECLFELFLLQINIPLLFPFIISFIMIYIYIVSFFWDYLYFLFFFLRLRCTFLLTAYSLRHIQTIQPARVPIVFVTTSSS